MKFYCFISVLFLWIISSTDKALSVYNSCEKKTKIQPIFAEIFGQGWEIDQNSNWQNDENELNSEDSIGNDQNNEQFNDQQKYESICKFHAIKEGIKKRGKYSAKGRGKIEQTIAEKLGLSRMKIYKWKKQLGLSRKNERSQKNYYEKKKREFVERIDEFKRMSKRGTQKQFAKELGIGKTTLSTWKREFGIKLSKRVYSNKEKISKMKDYYKMKNKNPYLSDRQIATFLKISPSTLNKWKIEKN